MHYLDASVIVAAVTDEPHRLAVRAWIREHASEMTISAWVLTEVSSALSIKVRDLKLSEADKLAATAQVNRMRADLFEHAVVDEAHFFVARELAELTHTGLRGGDALHVAIAADGDFTLVTLDRQMAKGARSVGLEVIHLPGKAQ